MTEAAASLIRQAGPVDAALLAELGAHTFSETFAATNKPEDMAAYLAAAFSPAQMVAELADPLATFFIAEVDARAAGYAKLYAGAAEAGIEGEKPIELVRLYVAQEWFGRGVGAALMDACVDEARRRGHRTLWLGVWEHNGRARAFYRKGDFRDVGQHIFQLGDDAQTDILMARAL